MSKQRFKKGVNLSCIDIETGKTYWYACNLRGLLNELAEENEQLKQEFAELLAVHTKIVETLDSEFVSKAFEDGD